MATMCIPHTNPEVLFLTQSDFIGLPGWVWEEEEAGAASVGVLDGVVHDGQQGQPRLLRRGDNLGSGQQEAAAPGVPELESERVLDALAVGPVNSAPTGLIWGGAETGESVSVLLARHRGLQETPAGPRPKRPKWSSSNQQWLSYSLAECQKV